MERQMSRVCFSTKDEWTALAPNFTAAQPEVTAWSEGMQVLSGYSAIPYSTLEYSACP